MDGNIELQRLFQNMNAIPSTIVPPTCGPHGVVPKEQQNLGNMASNWEYAELDDHVIEVVQQTHTIVDDV